MLNRAMCFEEHPWQNRHLPRRPTRLVAVPPLRPPEYRRADSYEVLALLGQISVEMLQMAAHSVVFLLMLVSILGGVWALSLL